MSIENNELVWHYDVVMKQLISYAVGCMMGRYSIDAPGLILANQGDSQNEYNAKVPNSRFEVDDDGIIPLMSSDADFSDNATLRFKQWLTIAFGDEKLVENLNFIEGALGKSLDDYFVKDFWKDHKKMYQNRPIYWLFSSKKGAFQCLVYMHRMNAYTAERIRTQYLLPHIEWLLQKQNEMEANAANTFQYTFLHSFQMQTNLLMSILPLEIDKISKEKFINFMGGYVIALISVVVCVIFNAIVRIASARIKGMFMRSNLLRDAILKVGMYFIFLVAFAFVEKLISMEIPSYIVNLNKIFFKLLIPVLKKYIVHRLSIKEADIEKDGCTIKITSTNNRVVFVLINGGQIQASGTALKMALVIVTFTNLPIGEYKPYVSLLQPQVLVILHST